MTDTWYAKAGADAQFATKAALALKADSSSLATVATSGSYTNLTDTPTIPAAQVASDWTASSGVAAILNKPTLGTAAAQNTTAFATAAQGAKADTAVQPAALSSYATTTALTTGLAGKVATTTTVNGHALSGNVILTASDVGAGMSGIAPRTGEYIWTAGSLDGSTYTLPASRAELAAIFLPAGTYQSAGCTIRTAGAAGNLIRIVLYKDDTLIKDFGTVSGETATAVTATASVIIATTGWYLIGLISQGVTTTAPAVNRVNPSNTAGILPNTKNDPQYSPGGSFGYAGITGAAPSDLSSTARATDNYAPAVNMRLA